MSTDEAIHRGENYTYSGPLATAYEFCSDTIRSAAQVARHVNQVHPDASPLTASDAKAILAELCDRGLMLSEGDKFLSLALPALFHADNPERYHG